MTAPAAPGAGVAAAGADVADVLFGRALRDAAELADVADDVAEPLADEVSD